MLLHWVTVILVLLASGTALFREAFARVSMDMIAVHKQAGLAILLVAVVRLAWRLTHRPPALPDTIGRFERRLADTVHRALYGLIILVPLTGWVFVSLAPISRPIDYRGPQNIPALPLGTNDSLSFSWHEAHELLGFALIGLFLLHIAGVIRHQLLKGDNLLGRMVAYGPPQRLATLAILCVALWAIGLALDVFAIRLMG